MVDSQIEVKKWFDNTYKRRGFGYLRPIDAYQIFCTLLSPQPKSKHLDVACGPGLMLKALEETGAIGYGIDISTEAIDRCKTFCPTSFVREGNAEKLPYDDETFDSITCIGSLERMLNRTKVLSEQNRVAKKGAKICYMVRNSENFTWKYLWKPLNIYNKKGHQDALNINEWKDLFEENGFEIGGIYPDHWPYYRFLKTIFPWSKIETAKIRKFPLKLELAYEFIFILRKI
ncbi:MAG: class I SAM-dependent methyltransferase [Cyclobacteriaceae bacterium]